jgi:hypothetical protein
MTNTNQFLCAGALRHVLEQPTLTSVPRPDRLSLAPPRSLDFRDRNQSLFREKGMRNLPNINTQRPTPSTTPIRGNSVEMEVPVAR